MKCGRFPRLIMPRAAGLSGPFFQPTRLSACIKSAGNYLGIGKPGSENLVFSALIADSSNVQQLQLIGQGTPTLTRASAIYVQDHEGIYRQMATNQPAWHGARYDGGVAYNTDSLGALLDPQPMLEVAPAATNLVTYSRDIVSGIAAGSWFSSSNPKRFYDQIGLTGELNTATYMEDDSPTNLEFVYSSLMTIGANTNTHCAVAYIKKDDDESRFPLLGVYQLPITAQWFINTKTGSVIASSNNTVSTTCEVVSVGDWWKMIVSFVGNGATSQISFRIFPAAASVFDGVMDDTSTGSFIFGNVELYDNKTIPEVRHLPPIFTSGASASIAATSNAGAFDTDNHSNVRGAYTIEWTPSFATAEVSGNIPILPLNGGADLLYYDATNGQIEATDGTNTAAKSLTTVAGTTYKLGLAYDASAGKMTLYVDGVSGTEANYDGGFTVGSELDVGPSPTYLHRTRNLRRYDLSYAAAKAKALEVTGA